MKIGFIGLGRYISLSTLSKSDIFPRDKESIQ